MATTSAATAATRRASPSTSPGEDPLLFDLGTGLRYFGLELPDRRAVPRHVPAQPPPLGPRPGPAVLRPAAARGQRARRVRPAQTTAARPPRCSSATIRPPLFPIGLDALPRPGRDPRAGDQVPHRRLRRRERAVPARRRGARLPGDARRGERRLHQRPPAAVDGAAIADSVCAPVPGRRPADPRRPVHAGRVRPQEHVGPLHRRVRGVAGRRGAGPSGWRCSTTIPGHDDDMIDRLAAAAAACGAAMGVEVFAAREGLVVDLAAELTSWRGRPHRQRRARCGVRAGRRGEAGRRLDVDRPGPSDGRRPSRWPPSCPGVELRARRGADHRARSCRSPALVAIGCSSCSA